MSQRVDTIAKLLWERFAPSHEVEWPPFDAAEYRSVAEDIARSALVEVAPAVAVPEGIAALAGSTFRLDEDRPALLVIEKPDGSCIEIKPGAHATYGEALAICRLLRDSLSRALAAAPQPPATRSYEEGRDDGIEAAASLVEDRYRKALDEDELADWVRSLKGPRDE